MSIRLHSVAFILLSAGMGLVPATEATAQANSVAPLDSPDNPYRDQYGPWDEWVYNHLDSHTIGPLRVPPADRPDFNFDTAATPPVKTINARLTNDGFLIPLLEGTRLNLEARVLGSHLNSTQQQTWIKATGPMSPELWAELMRRTDAILAEYVMPIPDWLMGENIPQAAMLLPNGEVVTRGPLGGIEPSESNSAFYRYSSEGRIIGESDSHWWFLYYDLEQLKDHQENLTSENGLVQFNGFVQFLDTSGNEIEHLLYNDSLLLPDGYSYSHIHFTFFGPKQLIKIFEAQQDTLDE